MLLIGVVTLLLFLSNVSGDKRVRAADKQFPFSALIIVNTKNSDLKFDETYCSGAVISDNFVITAKVCVDKVENFRIKLGPVHNGNKTEYSYDHSISTRPFFSTQYLVAGEADQALALIHLNPKCIFTPDIQPIRHSSDNVSDWLVESGYDNNVELDELELRWLQMEPVVDKECEGTYTKIDINAFMCARGPLINDERGDFCENLGGALIDEKRSLVGISVAQDTSPCKAASQIFARISRFDSWIRDVVEITPS